MSRKPFILNQDDLIDVKVDDLYCLGKVNPNDYVKLLRNVIRKSKLKIDTSEFGGFALTQHKQKEPIYIEDECFLAILICNPHLHLKKKKPNGLLFSDLSYLQVKEVLLQNIASNKLYIFEYSYHYGIWDYDCQDQNKDNESYYFRYDRDVLLKNPPRKEIEHLHVCLDKPHFNSSFVTLDNVVGFLENNWDYSTDRLDL